MRTLILTRGWPGAGKSYWIKESGLEGWALSADTIRLQLQGPVLTVDGKWTITQKNDNKVWSTLFQMLETRMARGELCVIDATHSKSSDFAKYKKLIEKYRYRIYVVDFSDRQLSDSLHWNSTRDEVKFVPVAAIENMYARITTQKAPSYVTVIKPHEIDNILVYKPLDFDKWDRIAVVGDIHSCWEPLNNYFTEHPYDEKTYYVFVGDFFDRGIQHQEILDWWIKHYNRENFVVLDSNHNVHFHKYSYDDIDNIKSNEFKFNTMPALEEYLKNNNIDKGICRNLCRRIIQMMYITYGPNTYFINHGGIPFLPSKLGLVASQEFTHGTGKYEQDKDVVETWNTKMPVTHYQIMGHRNVSKLSVINDRVINLEGQVEFGGNLRIVHLSKDGTIVPLEYKNNVYKINSNTVDSVLATQAPVNIDNKEWVDLLRGSKDIYEYKQDNISSFNFKRDVFFTGRWGDLSKTARALFVNNVTNNIVARSYVKFFNPNEMAETDIDNLRTALVWPATCYVKYNGYLGLLGFDNQTDQLVFTSKSSITSDFAGWFEEIFRERYGDNYKYIREFLKATNTCMVFEVMDPVRDPHIIEYKEKDIVLLDIFYRTFETKKLSYSELVRVAIEFGLPFKQVFCGLHNINEFNDFMSSYYQDGSVPMKFNNDYIEGVVLEDSSGFMVKIKSRYYNIWKFLRNIKLRMAKRRPINLGKLVTPEENYFYAFMNWLPPERLEELNIIELRNMFEAEKGVAV